MIANGDVFGTEQPVILHLLDIPPAMGVLEGVCMEIDDLAMPLVRGQITFSINFSYNNFLRFFYLLIIFFLYLGYVKTTDPEVAFKDVDAAFLVGSMPRREGMERKDLLSANVKIFKVQGEALNKFAKKNVKVLVVGNPANTNAFICSLYAPSIPKENFTAMTRLDQNRYNSLNHSIISY